MNKKDYVLLLTIIGCGLVTWIPRILPFIFSKKITFPKSLDRFLSFIPMCILVALFVQNLLILQKNGFPKVCIPYALASIPTFLVAVRTKNLMWTVIVGIFSMAVIRYFL